MVEKLSDVGAASLKATSAWAQCTRGLVRGNARPRGPSSQYPRLTMGESWPSERIGPRARVDASMDWKEGGRTERRGGMDQNGKGVGRSGAERDGTGRGSMMGPRLRSRALGRARVRIGLHPGLLRSRKEAVRVLGDAWCVPSVSTKPSSHPRTRDFSKYGFTRSSTKRKVEFYGQDLPVRSQARGSL